MKAAFAQVSNVDRLLAGMAIVQKRGASEASMMLVTSEPGYGKTETVHWYVTQTPHAVYLRAKSGWTRHWLLRDLLTELGISPMRLTEDLFNQAVTILASRSSMLVIDEIEHAFSDYHVLEAIRDISDVTEIPVVLVGMNEVKDKIRSRFPQISSRIATVVHFQPVSEEDIRTAAQALLDGVEIGNDVIQEIYRQCEGRMRLVLNALAVCERVAKARKAKLITLAEVDGQELIHDWQARPLKQAKVRRLKVGKA